ncbi:MAG TPA: hypothetical protein VF703_02330 [Pyrinomonadaceae bacterium]|jgi:hypothetical protein
MSRRLTQGLLCLSLWTLGTLAAYAQPNAATPALPAREAYLSWTAGQATDIGKQGRTNGRVGGAFDLRVIHTEHSYNYKLRATLMTPEVIRAAARLEQLRANLTDEQTRSLVAEAEAAAPLVVMVELDAREGSGVIPLDWRASLQPKGAPPDGISIGGASQPALRQLKALHGVARRDYAYDVFWVAFPVADGQGRPLLTPSVQALELVVGIYNKAGRVSWPVSETLRQRIDTLTGKYSETQEK